jgi:CheY-like chemotaxis protein
MELLSIEYGDFAALCDLDQSRECPSACLKLLMTVDPVLVSDHATTVRLQDALATVFPGVRGIVAVPTDKQDDTEMIVHLTGGFILGLQRDLCEWPSGSRIYYRSLRNGHEYELYVESINERVGRFAAQLAVNVMRMIMSGERFDPRLVWMIDLVRLLHRQPRLRLSPKRVAAQLGCSSGSAEWAVEELQRYGYVFPSRSRRTRRTKSGHILVVDDSAQIRDLLGRVLESMGYDVITAVDGEEGMILLDWAVYNAVFVDLMMPCMDGLTFLRQARAQGVACPLFVVSAYKYRWDLDAMEEAGATAFIAKPFSIAEIEELIQKYVK